MAVNASGGMHLTLPPMAAGASQAETNASTVDIALTMVAALKRTKPSKTDEDCAMALKFLIDFLEGQADDDCEVVWHRHASQSAQGVHVDDGTAVDAEAADSEATEASEDRGPEEDEEPLHPEGRGAGSSAQAGEVNASEAPSRKGRARSRGTSQAQAAGAVVADTCTAQQTGEHGATEGGTQAARGRAAPGGRVTRKRALAALAGDASGEGTD